MKYTNKSITQIEKSLQESKIDLIENMFLEMASIDLCVEPINIIHDPENKTFNDADIGIYL